MTNTLAYFVPPSVMKKVSYVTRTLVLSYKFCKFVKFSSKSKYFCQKKSFSSKFFFIFQGKLVSSMSREELDVATGPEDAVRMQNFLSFIKYRSHCKNIALFHSEFIAVWFSSSANKPHLGSIS
jgi:hypothetical protein